MTRETRLTRAPTAAAATPAPLAVPLAIGITPIGTNSDEGPLAWRWRPDDARELEELTDEMLASEDLVLLVSVPAPRADVAHALRALAAVIEEGIELQLKINDAYELPRRPTARRRAR